MSTQCRIARKNSSGLYDSIYCHNDGYPGYMLEMLLSHYNLDCRVAELIDYGDASSIKPRMMPTNFTHCFERPQEGVCVFYHRDRGESWEDVGTIYDDRKESVIRSSVDYVYIFEDGQWTVYSGGQEI